MDPINDARFYESLIKPPHLRSSEDVRNIFDQLRQLEMFATLYNAPLKAICASARYERLPPQQLLFREGQHATCWYILLSGSVFIDNHIFLPYGCFGKRNGLNYRRTTSCVVLQESEMIVIDYPDVQRIPVVSSSKPAALSHPPPLPPPPPGGHHLRRHVAVSHPSLDGSSAVTSSAQSSSSGSSLGGMNGVAVPSQPPPVPPRPPRGTLLPPARPPPRGLPRSYPVDFPIEGTSSSVPFATNVICNDEHRNQVAGSGSGVPLRTEDDSTLVRAKQRREKSNSIGSLHSAIRGCRVRSTASSSSTTEEAPSSSPRMLMVDSEEEDDESCPSHISYNDLKDSVRECLEKEPSMRNADDLSTLLDFMQHMSAFASLPMSIKRQLCLKMVYAVVPEAGTIVMHNNERLDAWSVIVNGQVEVSKPNGERAEYKLGDCFGAEPIATQQYHCGDMRTLVADCEFVLVEHKDFCSIMSTLGEHIEKDRDGLTGEVVSETERRTVGNHVGLVLIKGKPDKLISHLVEERDSSVDPHYVDDFLLTYRVFIHDPCTIFEKLMYLFADSAYRDRVARIVLLWVNNHHNDFETNDELAKLLSRFEAALERDGMHSQQSLLNIACSVKARPRCVQFSRASKDDPPPFVLVGGKELNSGIFVSQVDVGSTAEKAGVRKGDELIEVNSQSLKFATLSRANDLAKRSVQLSLLLKSNILGFKELISRGSVSEAGGGASSAAKQRTKAIVGALGAPRTSVPNVKAIQLGNGGLQGAVGPKLSAATLKPGGTGGMMDRLFTMWRAGGGRAESCGDDSVDGTMHRMPSSELRSSRSNPDLVNALSPSSSVTQGLLAQYYGPVRSEVPEHVLKIYRADQTFKYLPVYKETTAQNVVQLALQEFGMTHEGSLEWSLCETSVTPERVIKQRRLPPQMENLAERISLNGRYYLKNNSRSDPLVPDELAGEVLKEAQAQLLSLNAYVVAAQLTLQDFAVFSSIEPTEYIDNLFQLESRYGWARLGEFESIFNREMWWVGSEVCSEKNVNKRAKLIKKFIKIARYCRDLRNFNSMFAIYSGLEKHAVRRLHDSWNRVSGKYMKMLDEMAALVELSRNMSKYRQHLAALIHEPPLIPIYPVIKKDLTFMHEGNPTYSEKLVNFEKLRMIAREVRRVAKLCSAPYEINQMAERSGGNINDALLHMNTFEYGPGTVATMRKNHGKQAAQPRKKIYEQALMVRKVKAYLAELLVVDSESALDALSLEAEPSTAPSNGERVGSSSASASMGSSGLSRRPPRVPSPTPSSLSSQSAGSASALQAQMGPLRGFVGAKFGVDSPNAVQKMMNLVHQSKTKERSSLPSSTASSPVTKGVRPVASVQRVPSLTSRPESVEHLNAESSSVTGYYHPGEERTSALPPPLPRNSALLPNPPSTSSNATSLHRPLVMEETPSSYRQSYPGQGARVERGLQGVLLGHRPVPVSGHRVNSAPSHPIRVLPINRQAPAPFSDEEDQISRV